jgi:hypothetical protein
MRELHLTPPSTAQSHRTTRGWAADAKARGDRDVSGLRREPSAAHPMFALALQGQGPRRPAWSRPAAT